MSTFESLVLSGMDILMPLKPMKMCNNEPAWINPQLKSLILQRQKALAKGDQAQTPSTRIRFPSVFILFCVLKGVENNGPLPETI